MHRPSSRLASLIEAWGAWIILGTGLAAAVILVPIVAVPAADPYAGIPDRIGHLWLEELKGRAVTLPSKDVQGYDIPQNPWFYVVTLPCSQCTSLTLLRTSFLPASRKPVLLVVEALSQPMLETFGSDPHNFLIVTPNQSRQVVPDKMLEFAPQAALVGPDKVIRAVPAESQTIVNS